MSDIYDLLLTWDWEFDKEFVGMVREISLSSGLRPYIAGPENIEEAEKKLKKDNIRFKVLLDRASDTDSRFDSLISEVIISGTKPLNEAGHAIKAMDKATMHLEFLTKGIDVPYTKIISSGDGVNFIRETDLNVLGKPFIIKPSKGGGGCGVVKGEGPADILEAQKEYEDDKYLLQEIVSPVLLGGRRAYFRVFYVCGRIISCWWDDKTHIFTNITEEEEANYRLDRLKEIAAAISEVCRLDFFSTEICITAEGRYVTVDYVNDPCDMRPQSVYKDGVPDNVIQDIISGIISFVRKAELVCITQEKREILARRRDFELALLRRHR